MPIGAKITVKPQGQLFVQGARIYNACDGGHWAGITVEGTGSGSQDYDPVNQTFWQGRASLSAGATIERAVVGVQCQVPNSPFTTGGIVVADGARFLNCQQRLVDIRDFQNESILTGQATGSACRFSGCDFKLDGDFEGSFAYFTEMAYLKNVDGIQFAACRFHNDLPASIAGSFADDRRFGITSFNAGFSVGGTCSSLPCNWQRSEFRGFYRAIYTGNKGSARTFSVSRSDFSDNLAAIYAAKVDLAYIVNNHFEVGSTLPLKTPQLGDPANRGIELYGCTGYKVEDNDIERFSGSGTQNPVGILVNASGSEPNEIYKNQINGMLVGNLSNSRNRNSNDASIGLQYICNSNSENGLFDFSVPEETGANSYGIAGNQGAANLAAGNKFTVAVAGSDPELHIHNNQNTISYFHSFLQNENPTNITSNTVQKINAPSNTCPSKQPTDPNEEGELTSGEQGQYKQDFKNSQEAAVRAYSANMVARSYLIDSTGQEMDSVRVWLRNKGSLEARFSIVDTYLQQGDTAAALQSLGAIPSEFALSGEPLAEYDLFQDLKSLQIGALQLGMDDAALVGSKRTDLEAIAGTGDRYAALQAQNLLNSVDGPTYFPDVVLPLPNYEGLVLKPGTTVGNAQAWAGYRIEAVPNPAQEQTMFHYMLPVGAEAGQIIVKGADGKHIATLEVVGQGGRTAWETKHLPDGVYFYTLVVEKTALTTERLIIAR